MLSVIQSFIGIVGALSFAISISCFSKRNERKLLVVFGLGSLILIVMGFL